MWRISWKKLFLTQYLNTAGKSLIDQMNSWKDLFNWFSTVTDEMLCRKPSSGWSWFFFFFWLEMKQWPLNTAQKLKFPLKEFFSKCDQIRRKLRIWLHLLKKSFMVNFIFCAVQPTYHMWETISVVSSRICLYYDWLIKCS